MSTRHSLESVRARTAVEKAVEEVGDGLEHREVARLADAGKRLSDEIRVEGRIPQLFCRSRAFVIQSAGLNWAKRYRPQSGGC